jgi:hypothetical protein
VINKKLMEGKEHMIRNEIAVLRRISIGHANILTLVDYFETLNNCKCYLKDSTCTSSSPVSAREETVN